MTLQLTHITEILIFIRQTVKNTILYISMDDMLNQNLYAGGNAEGYVVGMIKKDDKAPKLAYGLLFGSESIYGKSIWFALQ